MCRHCDPHSVEDFLRHHPGVPVATVEDCAALRAAWESYPGRSSNDNIHKDFLAGWRAGREYQGSQPR